MKVIQIVSGTYGYRPAGGTRIDPRRAGDPPIEVEDAEANRLVSLKVAVYVEEFLNEGQAPAEDDTGGSRVEESPAGGTAAGTGDEDGAEPGVNPPEEETGTEGAETAKGKPEYTSEMKADELRDLMKDCGLSYKVGMSKEDMVAALDDYYDAETGTSEEDEEAPPSLGAEEPVI